MRGWKKKEAGVPRYSIPVLKFSGYKHENIYILFILMEKNDAL